MSCKHIWIELLEKKANQSVAIMVNKIIMAIVEIIGPTELLEKQESIKEIADTTVKAINAAQMRQKNAMKYR